LDVAGQFRRLDKACSRLKKSGIAVSLFIAADHKQIRAAAQLGVSMIELHTGAYAQAFMHPGHPELKKIISASVLARKLGLIVNAGHGLNYENVKPIAAIEEMHELNIGHSIISHAVFVGLDKAVKEMVRLIR
jgi:pyridoxine 5-phosphate synthase